MNTQQLEHCCLCDEATGRAGRGDGSIFIDVADRAEIGPLCIECLDGIKNWCNDDSSESEEVEGNEMQEVVKGRGLWRSRDGRCNVVLSCIPGWAYPSRGIVFSREDDAGMLEAAWLEGGAYLTGGTHGLDIVGEWTGPVPEQHREFVKSAGFVLDEQGCWVKDGDTAADIPQLAVR